MRSDTLPSDGQRGTKAVNPFDEFQIQKAEFDDACLMFAKAADRREVASKRLSAAAETLRMVIEGSLKDPTQDTPARFPADCEQVERIRR